MPLIQYLNKSIRENKLDIIANVNRIVADYNEKGFSLTLRQIYYQFVSRDLIPQDWANEAGILNRPESYDKLGDIISDGRLAGLIDWNAIVDRSRSSYANQHWDRPSSIIRQAMRSYATDKWLNQDHYVEVWVEKEALEDVLSQACGPLDVRYFACKGYTSQSAMWEASQRLVRKIDDGKQVHIIHLGDHDPSGIDMSRDIYDRLSMFTYSKVHVDRIALNMDQVQQYNPPPNPAKSTDSRYKSYLDEFGDESWELDALEPQVLVELIQNKIKSFRDEDTWEQATEREEKGRSTLKYICQYFPDVVTFLKMRRTKDDSRIVCAGCGATENCPECMCDAGESRGFALGPAEE